MSEQDRPTTWMPFSGWGWHRWLLLPVPCVRLLAVGGAGDGWRWGATSYGDDGRGCIVSTDAHALPTREQAQSAAEQWVREWAAGLIEAVGDDTHVCDQCGEREATEHLTDGLDWCEPCLSLAGARTATSYHRAAIVQALGELRDGDTDKTRDVLESVLAAFDSTAPATAAPSGKDTTP